MKKKTGSLGTSFHKLHASNFSLLPPFSKFICDNEKENWEPGDKAILQVNLTVCTVSGNKYRECVIINWVV